MKLSRDFVLKGLLVQIGSTPDYSIRLNAVSWLDKGVLTLQDIQRIDAAMKAQTRQAEPAVSEGGGEDGG